LYEFSFSQEFNLKKKESQNEDESSKSARHNKQLNCARFSSLANSFPTNSAQFDVLDVIRTVCLQSGVLLFFRQLLVEFKSNERDSYKGKERKRESE
jgi:hypothetical protein